MATSHNLIKAFLDAEGDPAESVTLRDADLHTGHLIPLGMEDFSSALISVDNDLDQNVDIVVQGANVNEGSWHTSVAATTIAAGGSDHINLAETWSMIRITYQAAGIPTTGTLRCGIQRARGGGLIESAAGGIAVDVNVTDRAARDLGKVDIADIDGFATVQGQKAMAASLPVVIASNQTVIPVSDNAVTLSVDDGAGTITVDQATHDNLQGNANLQVANVDVANGNPVPVSDAGGTLTVDQGTHDNLLVNATLQIADADVSATIPVPVRGFADPFEIVLTLDTNIYATNDLLADTQVITGICTNSRSVILYDLRIVDEDDQGTAIDLYFLRSNTSLGTENLAYAPTDAMSREILWKVPIAAADWYDEGAYREAQKALPDNIGCVMAPVPAGANLWIAAVCRSGTPTYTASGIRVTIGVIQNG